MWFFKLIILLKKPFPGAFSKSGEMKKINSTAMKTLVKVLKGVIVLVILLIIGLYFYLQHLKPHYKGTLQLSGLQEKVEVWFDDYGIPHIYAQNKLDLYRALGYVHAQERLWQMELVRRIAPGRLSEILGKDLLETDKFFRTLGIHLSSSAAATKLRAAPVLSEDYEVLQQTEAYLAGINQFVENGPTPLEYSLLGIEKTPFVLEDVYNAVGYMSFSFAAAHKTDPLVNYISRQLGPAWLDDLGIKGDTSRAIIPSHAGDTAKAVLSSHVFKILEKLPASPFIGSNSWVLGPQKTKSGKVIFANDPHIGFSQPAVWYEAYLETPDFEIYGYHLAGYPFAILGHNRRIAVGLTMLENDDIDFYEETVADQDSATYLVDGEQLRFESRREVIQVKGADPVKLMVRSTIHGPVVNDVLGERAGKKPLSMFWTFNQLENELLQATCQLNNAKSPQDVATAAARIHAPGLNVMYGDAAGNYAWWATAKLIKRPGHVNSFGFLDGAGGQDEPLGFYAFEENPHAINPPWGYVYSANNQPDSIGGSLYPGYYMPEDRAKRINQLLQSRNDWDRESVKRMLMDETSLVAKQITASLLPKVIARPDGVSSQAVELMTSWDGSFAGDRPEPVIFSRWMYELLSNAMEDELGEEYFQLFMNTDLRKRTLPRLVENPASPWWDNAGTAGTRETMDEAVNGAFAEAIAFLVDQHGRNVSGWTWRQVHTLTHGHALGVVPILGKLLNVGEFKVSSGEELINNLGYSLTNEGLYKVTFGPSTRRVVDFGDIENSESILPTGQSGVISSPHYDDQAEMFVKGKFRKTIINKEELTSAGRLLSLLPK